MILTTITAHLLEFSKRGYPVPMRPLPNQTAEGSMKMAKLCWCIGNKSGNGLWHYVTPSVEMGLQANVKAMNKRYGDGTHWLEYRDA